MFQARPKDEAPDWTDTLTQKGIPVGGALAGGILAGYYTGGNPAAIAAGAQAGYGLGETVGGLISDKPGSPEQTRLGTAAGVMGLSGLANYARGQRQYGTPQVSDTGKDPQRPGVSPVSTYVMPDKAAPVGVPDDNRKWKWGPPE